jgi:2-methylcitrate dehydratase PrpD
MDNLSSTLLLKLAFLTYATAALGSLLSLRREKLANALGFGGAILAGA